MNEDRSKLEYELTVVEKKLDKEKRKRNIIMIVLCSILCGCGITAINDNFDSLTDIIFLIIMSVFFGTIIYVLSILAFAAVTDLFTSITYLQSRKNHLEEKLKTNDDDY